MHEILTGSGYIQIDEQSYKLATKATTQGKQAEILRLYDRGDNLTGLVSKKYSAGVKSEVALEIAGSFTTPEMFLGTMEKLYSSGQVEYDQCKRLISAYTEAKALEVISATDSNPSPLEYKGCWFVSGENGYDMHLVMNAILMNENNNEVLAQPLNTEVLWPPGRGKAAIAIATAMKCIPDNVIHRDIKPGNILWLENEGVFQAILIDFGIARIDGDDYMERFHNMIGKENAGVLGSPGYMGPERMLKNKDGLGTEGAYTDTFSVGALLMKIFTGYSLSVNHNNQGQNWVINVKGSNGGNIGTISEVIQHSHYKFLEKIISSSLMLNHAERIYDRRIPLLLAGLLVNAHNGIDLMGADRNVTMECLQEIVNFTARIGGTTTMATDNNDNSVMGSIMKLPPAYQQTLTNVMGENQLGVLPSKLRNGGRG